MLLKSSINAVIVSVNKREIIAQTSRKITRSKHVNNLTGTSTLGSVASRTNLLQSIQRIRAF